MDFSQPKNSLICFLSNFPHPKGNHSDFYHPTFGLPMFVLHVNAVIQDTVFCVWLLLLNMVFLRNSHFVICINGFFLFLSVISLYKCISMCLCIPICIYMDCFHFEDVMNKVYEYASTSLFVDIYFSFSQINTQQQNCWVAEEVNVNCQTIFQSGCTILNIFPPAMYKGSSSPHPHQLLMLSVS